jgi:hypothetical protein
MTIAQMRAQIETTKSMDAEENVRLAETLGLLRQELDTLKRERADWLGRLDTLQQEVWMHAFSLFGSPALNSAPPFFRIWRRKRLLQRGAM